MKRYIKCYKLQPVKVKKYHIIDLDVDIIVEETTRKEILSYLDEYLDNLESGYDMSDYAFYILYSNGDSVSIVENDYNDTYKIKRQNIVSMVFDNPETSMTFGPYSINDSGVVTPSFEMEIDDNIELVGEK